MKSYIRNYRFTKIRTAIAAPIMLFFIIGTILIVFIVMEANQIAVGNALEELQKASSSLVIKELNNELGKAVGMNEIHANAFLRGIINFQNEKQRDSYFVSLLESNPGTIMTYIGYPNGEFYGARRLMDQSIQVVENNQDTGGHSIYYHIDTNGNRTDFAEKFENYDPRTRPWYQLAQDSKNLSFTSLYSHFIYKEPTITGSIPVYQGDELQAIFGVDYLMTWLGATLSELPIGENGQVMIINQNQEIVSSTTEESIFYIKEEKSVNRTLQECTHPLSVEILEIIEELDEDEFLQRQIKGKNYYIGMDTYESYGLAWRIFTVLYEEDFMKELDSIYIQTALLLIVFVLIFFVFIFYITRILVKPILKLDQATKKLVEGQFKPEFEEGRRDEIGRLTSNFNIMGAKLTSLVGNLEKIVEERTSELEVKNELLKSMSYRDELSGIGNRRKYNEFADAAIHLSIRTKQALAILMMDIDYFKDYNDSYGHVKGDHCIHAIGEILHQVVRRQTDLAARYGGEEFVVVLQDTREEEALKIAQEIQTQLKQKAIEHQGNREGILTMSIGIYIGTPNKEEGLEQITGKADTALYKAKDSGRNKICLYGQ